jgi:hypothetical protein
VFRLAGAKSHHSYIPSLSSSSYRPVGAGTYAHCEPGSALSLFLTGCYLRPKQPGAPHSSFGTQPVALKPKGYCLSFSPGPAKRSGGNRRSPLNVESMSSVCVCRTSTLLRGLAAWLPTRRITSSRRTYTAMQKLRIVRLGFGASE